MASYNGRVTSGHNTARSPTSFANSLGQIQATIKVLDLAKPLSSTVRIKNLFASGDTESSQSKKYDNGGETPAPPDISDYCKVFDTNDLAEKYITSILINTPKKNLWQNSDDAIVKSWKAQTDFQFGFIPFLMLKNQNVKRSIICRNIVPLKPIN